jgi:hypothetical protein
MRACIIRHGTLVAVLFAVACSGGERAQEAESQEWSLDRRSWTYGAIAAFSEMVDYGVRQLALGPPLAPAETDEIIDEAIRIAAAHDVEIYRETDFLVTDLFSAGLTEGKHVLIIGRASAFQEYEALKADKKRLEDSGEYHGEARTEIARRFGRLLSYPEAHIEAELTQ